MTRISASENEDGYRYFEMLQANGKRVHVFLDGVEVQSCVTADDEQGFVVGCVLDERGDVQVDPIDNNRVWEERVTGKVEIKVEDAT